MVNLVPKRASAATDLARKIVAELIGEIKVESAVGEGTTFHVRVPAAHFRPTHTDKTHAPG